MNAFFDLETLSLNPYTDDAKIILAQIKYGDKIHLLKEWELGEEQLIVELAYIFSKFPKYTPVFTYNGGFDFHYLMGRIHEYSFDYNDKEKLHDVFIRNVKSCDLLQFDNGYFVAFYKICHKYNMPLESKYNGSQMKELYETKRYDFILEHGLEDIIALEKIVIKTDLADRFLKTEILDWGLRRLRRT